MLTNGQQQDDLAHPKAVEQLRGAEGGHDPLIMNPPTQGSAALAEHVGRFHDGVKIGSITALLT